MLNWIKRALRGAPWNRPQDDFGAKLLAHLGLER
jgi:hypothetical protein